MLLEERVQRQGYAWRPERALEIHRRHLNWQYPVFEEQHAYHFATTTFGVLHSFRLLEEQDGRTRIAFCAKDQGSPWMSGTLSVASDSGFESATWSVATDDPKENAGGEVLFGDFIDSAGQRHLISVRGVFWRHNGRAAAFPDLPRSYYQLIRLNSEWAISDDAGSPECLPSSSECGPEGGHGRGGPPAVE